VGDQRDPDLVPAAEGHLQSGRGSDAAVEWKRDDRVPGEERRRLLDVRGLAREVEVDAVAADQAPVDHTGALGGEGRPDAPGAPG
jgi:hypothetical protein